MDKAKARKRLEEERARLQRIQDDLQREQEESTSETGGETFEMEKNVSLREQVDDELREIEAAFVRLDRGTYGICQACREPVGDERLEAMPATRFCIEDQAKAERQAGSPGSRS